MLFGAVLFLLFAAAAAGFLFWFTNPARFPSTATLWTDRAEFAAYAELFNASQDEYRIEVVFRREPARTAGSGPDLVVSPFLNDPATITGFAPLKTLFADGKRSTDKHTGLPLLTEEQFYSGFLDPGKNGENGQTVLPVSFNLPALAFLKEGRDGGDQLFSLNLDIIREESAAFNTLQNGNFVRMGFSPRWNPEVLYVKTALFDTGFRSGPEPGSVVWDEGQLDEAVTFIRDWIGSVNQGLEMEQYFIDTYMYDPPIKLLTEGRILFTYTTLRDFFHLQPDIRSSLDFRWMASEGSIPVADDALYIGIPLAADAKPAARTFLLWFFSRETQIELIRSAQFKRMRTFGIAEGLSSLRSINEEIIPQFYPSLVGHIPPENFLSFPPPLPPRWNSIRKEVVIPWLLETAAEAEPERAGSLQERLDVWFRQKSID